MSRLHAVSHGDPDLPPVALVHGMMSSGRQWQPNVDTLSRHFRLVVVDLWGHGSSPTPDDPSRYGADGLTAALDEVRTRLGIERWGLIGHSFGGAVALRYALGRPTTTRAVVFTNSRAAMSTTNPAAASEAAERITATRDPRTLPMHPVRARHIPAALHRQLILDADRTDMRALGHLIATAWQLSVRADLGRLALPTTLVNGRFERRFQPEAEVIRAVGPPVVVVDVDAGHSPNVEAADDFNHIAVRSLAV